MNGYEKIREMSDIEISKAFMVGILAAVTIRNSTVEEMAHNACVCPQLISGQLPGKCSSNVYNCVTCRKEFLENEVPVL
ncbi:MAG: hypothetical protein Q4B70_00945 [Lachnospiraceae bacterium]|nr:hypothetical protein [Lachnospiraceae bacterium]